MVKKRQPSKVMVEKLMIITVEQLLGFIVQTTNKRKGLQKITFAEMRGLPTVHSKLRSIITLNFGDGSSRSFIIRNPPETPHP